MAQFQEREFSFENINNGRRYENGDVVTADALNAVVEASAYAVTMAKIALAQTSANSGGVSEEMLSTFATKSELSQYAPKSDFPRFKVVYDYTEDTSQDIYTYVQNKIREYSAGEDCASRIIQFNRNGSYYFAVGYYHNSGYAKYLLMQYGPYVGVTILDCYQHTWTASHLHD